MIKRRYKCRLCGELRVRYNLDMCKKCYNDLKMQEHYAREELKLPNDFIIGVPFPLKGKRDSTLWIHHIKTKETLYLYNENDIRKAIEWLKIELKDFGLDRYDSEDKLIFDKIDEAFADVMKND